MFFDLRFNFSNSFVVISFKLTAVRYTHLCLFTVVYVHCFEYNFFLKVKLDSKSRDPLWQIIALRIYSHARWVILFQDLVQLGAVRRVSPRPSVFVPLYQ